MPVSYEKRDHVGIVTLSRPGARNAWGPDFNEGLGNFPKPIVGAVNGYAVGIGCIATFCCDLLVASDRAEWRLPQVSLGILPAYGGGARLARWVGKGHAMRLALGIPLTADEAYRIGLAQWLGAHAQLIGQGLGIAAHIPP